MEFHSIGAREWKSCRGVILAIATGIAVLTILVARCMPPPPPHTYSEKSFHDADRDQRQYFEHEKVQWLNSPDAAAIIPPPAMPSHLQAGAATAFGIVMDGWHYNRPPPIG
jgi:hypothetical protein